MSNPAKTCEHGVTPKTKCRVCENARKLASKHKHQLAKSSTTSTTAA